MRHSLLSEQYLNMFSLSAYAEKRVNLKEKFFGELKIKISPLKFVVDFKQTVRKTISIIFPTTIKRGYDFHLGQAPFRKIYQPELSVLYRKAEDEVRK